MDDLVTHNHDHVSHRLTPREAEILRLLAAGYSRGEVAALLGIRYPTVNTHVDRIFRALGVDCLVRALNVARATGMVASTCHYLRRSRELCRSAALRPYVPEPKKPVSSEHAPAGPCLRRQFRPGMS